MMASDLAACEPREVFTKAFNTHQQKVYAYFFGRTGNVDTAKDLLQETFLRAWRHVHVLQGMEESQHQYWLFSIAKNLLTDYYRRQKRKTQAESQLQFEANPAAPDSQRPDRHWQAREDLLRLDSAIAQLPEDQRTVLAMNVLGELNSSQISDLLDKPAGTIRYQLSTARKRLAQIMELESQ
jgi:RNA polymerase sigma-70 factor (ECF subfamily)